VKSLEKNLPLREQDRDKTIIEFVKHIEKSIFKCHKQIKSLIRGQIIPILNRLLGFSSKTDFNYKFLLY